VTEIPKEQFDVEDPRISNFRCAGACWQENNIKEGTRIIVSKSLFMKSKYVIKKAFVPWWNLAGGSLRRILEMIGGLLPTGLKYTDLRY